MGFYNNIGVDFPVRTDEEMLEVGECGKFSFEDFENRNFKTVKEAHSYRVSPKYPVLNVTLKEGNIKDFINTLYTSNPSDLFNIEEGIETTYEYEHVKIDSTIYYVTDDLKKFSNYKRESTKRNHACAECAFKGHGCHGKTHDGYQNFKRSAQQICDQMPMCTKNTYFRKIDQKDIEHVEIATHTENTFWI